MKTPFRLNEHPRRPAPPLAPPPEDYFDKLPLRVMQRVRPQEPAAAPLLGWLTALSAPLRTALASLLLLVGFVGTFWLTQRALPQSGAPLAATRQSSAQALAAVPRAEAVQYLLSDEAARLSLAELSETTVADHDLTSAFLPATDAEIQAALDEQPSVDVYL
ncbi:hypothetical protein [Hymenobacter sp. CRA2]|uniref:hypothetical protein n=1 Tax=Hymenobacter sp. CRA2 TaxID=1955620 RepID=UPI00098F916A|nr:hypothetical protein [Hymenobacter sp. CRA2]OON66941.1 hypothetical protein B0919_20370 [Hymenobacter sp. CRA2]